MLPVLVNRSCLLSLVESSIEVYNRETAGMLIGQPRTRKIYGKPRRMVVLDVAFPLQTADRRILSVGPGNVLALRRARSAIGSLGYQLLGEYHSHTNNTVGLSGDDLTYAKEMLLESGKRQWLELIIAMRKKDYARPRRVGWTWRDYQTKVGCTVRITPDTGFDITFGAYWVYFKGPRPRHHRLGEGRDLQRVGWKEVPVWIPWTQDHYWA